MAISDVVTSTLALADASPNRADFGTPLIVADAPYVGSQLFTADPAGLAAMITAGFFFGSRAYHIAQDIAAQNNGTNKFWVRARAVPHVQIFNLTPVNTTEGFVYKFDVSAWNASTSVQAVTSITYTNGAAETVASIVTALHALVDAIVGVTAVDSVTTIDMGPTTVGTFVYADGLPLDLELKDDGVDAGIETELTAALVEIVAAGGDFYGILIDAFSETEINSAATWAESNSKIFMSYSTDADIPDGGSTTDVASDISGSNYHYTGVFAGRASMSKHTGACSMSYLFGQKPGQAVVANRTLQGPVADNWTPTAKTVIHGKIANAYVLSAGISHGLDGWAGSQRYFDITRNNDWFQNLLETTLLAIIIGNNIIPYTDAGLALLESGLRAACNESQTQGVLATGWTVDVVPVADVSVADKAARVYNGFTINGTIQGAIQSVNFSIFLKV